jgi:hypothetical protein
VELEMKGFLKSVGRQGKSRKAAATVEYTSVIGFIFLLAGTLFE